MEKVEWNSIDKNKMDLNIWKMTNHPPSHVHNQIEEIENNEKNFKQIQKEV